MLFWEILRWCMVAVLGIDGIMFLWVTGLAAHDMRKHPHHYPEDAAGRITYKQLLALFGGAGVACVAIAILFIL